MKTTIVLVIDHKKPIADLTDIAAGRIYTLDGVEDVTATMHDPYSDKNGDPNYLCPAGRVQRGLPPFKVPA